MNKRIVFVGPCGGGSIPQNGASVKNFFILKSFSQKAVSYRVIDTEFWRKKPLILLKLVWNILTSYNKTFIISADSSSAYKLLLVLSILKHPNTIYWVIGGSIANRVKLGEFRVFPYKNCKHILVEGDSMKQIFNECGLRNVMTVPNFKTIDYIPSKAKRNNDIHRFVFLSRITPDKGCDEIIKSVRHLNNIGFEKKFSVTFYGPIQESYKKSFLLDVKEINNVEYGGFLDLRDKKNYDILSAYDVMLFPTFWIGEGFPGVLIDALIAGIPVIASDWNLNKDIIIQGETGIIIPVHDTQALIDTMLSVILRKIPLENMVKKCHSEALKYDFKNVLNDELYKRIGLF